MEVIADLADPPALAGGTVVTIGAFDGVHTGHRALVEEVRRLAATRGCATPLPWRTKAASSAATVNAG